MKLLLIGGLAAAVMNVVPLACVAAQAAAPVAAPVRPAKQFVVLTDADVIPERVLPAPPAAGSPLEALELAQLHALIAQTSAARLAQARWDDAHEDPAIFDAVLGVSLTTLPATWALLRAVQNDADLAANRAKEYFHRTRPWGADATLPNCDTGTAHKPTRSYPSGHASLGYSVGFVLAQLVPAKAPAILDRASDYSLSRQICGVHFASDAEASHVLGSLVATRFLLAPAMADRIAAARAELAAAVR